MWRGKKSNAQTRRAINAFQHCTSRTFAIRAGDVDEAKLSLWIAHERGELACVFQPEICAKNLQAVKKLNRFSVGHG